MKNLPKDKRNRLILVIGITILGLAGLYFGLISYQEKRLDELAESKGKLQGKLDTIQQVVRNAEFVETEGANASKKLSDLESDMVAGDPYAWMYSKMKEFKSGHKVEFQLVPTGGEQKDASLLPKFPYKYVSFTVQGTAFFHDFGKFLADLENHFPLFRVLNLDLSPVPAAQAETEKEKLNFKMEILPLVKPGA